MRKIFAAGLVVMVACCVAPMLAGGVFAESEANSEFEYDSYLNFGQLSELGGSYTDSFKVRNNGETELKLELSIEPSRLDGVRDENKLASDWLAFVGGAVRQTVPAQEEKDIRLRATLPADAAAGSQYATVKILINGEIEHYVDVRLDVMGDDLRYNGTLRHAGVSAVNFGKEIKATVVAENQGTGGFQLKNFVQYKKGLNGAAEWTTLVDETAEVAPGAEERLGDDKSYELGYGIFSVEQKISYVNADGELIEQTRAQTVVNCPLWLALVVAGVIVGAVAIVIALKRRRGKLAASA
ncbi:hypothetical protein IJ102_03215 [Candidatus Saccharibacteria bacterium]|nr:hypothetical protein [Candidatus Saccharibacteria bacterium]